MCWDFTISFGETDAHFFRGDSAFTSANHERNM
jgi:hypothetical protein